MSLRTGEFSSSGEGGGEVAFGDDAPAARGEAEGAAKSSAGPVEVGAAARLAATSGNSIFERLDWNLRWSTT